jgi:putative nucleotidyltransferase with HDIG domain
MIKMIPAEELKVGMYIHDLNCDWMSHPFARSRFEIDDAEKIARITAAGIREVYIDTDLGIDATHAPTAEEVSAQVHQDMLAIAREPAPYAPTTFEEELERARSARKQAEQFVQRAMQDVRNGKALKIDGVDPIIDSVTSSVMRNAGALLSLVGIKDKDQYTIQHSAAVCALMVAFARHEGMPSDLVHQAGLGGLLHDIGKARVPEPVLNKNGTYTEEEFAIMRRHTEDGYDMLVETGIVEQVPLQMALEHHEREDGTGYPYNLRSAEITKIAQMTAIVDVYDAITAERSYRAAMQPTDGLRKLMEWSKFHLNPYLTHSFIRCVGIYPVGTLVKLESGLLGIVTEHNVQDLLRPKLKIIFDTKRNQYVPPRPLDLARPLGSGGGDAIVSHESPRKWFINMEYFQ